MRPKSNEIEGTVATLYVLSLSLSSAESNFWFEFVHFYSRFACPFCGKCVRSKENLKLHVRKHTGERPFVCLFCGRAFGGKSDLTRHLRIHTGKSWVCFNHSDEMNVPFLAGERPYHCESCGKCFARADYLSKHLTTHVHNSTPRWNEGRRRRILHNR